MRRRSFAEEQTSSLAIWARRIAFFSLAATIIAIIIVRSGALDIVPALSTLAGALVLACVAILLALGAGVSIWRDGVAGGRQAVTALLIGFVLIAYPVYLGIKARNLPAIYDVTTDPIDPPQFDAIARLRPRDANPVTYAGLYAAEQQHNAYSDIEPDDTNSTPQEAYEAAMKVIIKRKWRVVDSRPPQAPPAVPTPRNVAIQPAPARDGIIEAVALTPILGFRDDVVVRIRPTADGARIDVRSASRYGRNDLGTNAARVRNLIDDIDTVLATPQPQKKQAVPPPPPQAAGKGASAKR
ncbi:MAG TPA: DUF1499 domain-containing protein [Xanthobacteraceae bacterium]|jgi:hypothetical protein|nr:DUF1499 domain-containing protein [Xanthobacteraceae bacterium]